MDRRAARRTPKTSSPGRTAWAGRLRAPPAFFRALLICAAALLAPLAAAASPILPAPALERPADGIFHLDARTEIAAPAGDASALASARYLADLMARTRGLKLRVVEGAPDPGAGAVVLRRGGAVGEGYVLDVTPQAIVIQSNDDAGLFYGAVSAWQLATPERGQGAVDIPGLHVVDAPRFAWRGLMLDPARNFQSPAFVEAFIDRMARAKLNTLQWHLADDQGWRLEIRKYPRLTEVGAWRVPAGPAAAADIDRKTGQPRRIGGFYTQAQVREIVAYAAARHITIVPEIEMPGHAQAAIAAYPELGAAARPPSGASSDWGVHPHLYNVDEKTFGFLEDVLTEVMELFPSRYIHIGGDEAVKAEWKASPAVQTRMRDLWIGNEDALQGWFVARMGTFLAAHGRRLVGWDEILQGGVAPGATVMSWRGLDGAIVAAKLGHDTVVAPQPIYYFDNRQDAGPDEPPGRGRLVALKDVYDFEPVPPILTPAERLHVVGVQAQLWSEHIRTEDRVSRAAFPRALAVAETGWSPAARKDWTDFTGRLDAEMARERALGETYGTWSPASPAAAVSASRSRASQELTLCTSKVALNLEDDAPVNGPRARFLVDIMNPCWIWPAADLTGVNRIEAAVGQLPFNFQIGDDIKKVVLHPPVSAAGELEVRQDRCDGPVIASLSLAPALKSQGVTRLKAPLAATAPGPHDLCFTFTQGSVDPLWVIDRVTLPPGQEARRGR
jgi:hexosaminidase